MKVVWIGFILSQAFFAQAMTKPSLVSSLEEPVDADQFYDYIEEKLKKAFEAPDGFAPIAQRAAKDSQGLLSLRSEDFEGYQRLPRITIEQLNSLGAFIHAVNSPDLLFPLLYYIQHVPPFELARFGIKLNGTKRYATFLEFIPSSRGDDALDLYAFLEVLSKYTREDYHSRGIEVTRLDHIDGSKWNLQPRVLPIIFVDISSPRKNELRLLLTQYDTAAQDKDRILLSRSLNLPGSSGLVMNLTESIALGEGANSTFFLQNPEREEFLIFSSYDPLQTVNNDEGLFVDHRTIAWMPWGSFQVLGVNGNRQFFLLDVFGKVQKLEGLGSFFEKKDSDERIEKITYGGSDQKILLWTNKAKLYQATIKKDASGPRLSVLVENNGQPVFFSPHSRLLQWISVGSAAWLQIQTEDRQTHALLIRWSHEIKKYKVLTHMSLDQEKHYSFVRMNPSTFALSYLQKAKDGLHDEEMVYLFLDRSPIASKVFGSLHNATWAAHFRAMNLRPEYAAIAISNQHLYDIDPYWDVKSRSLKLVGAILNDEFQRQRYVTADWDSIHDLLNFFDGLPRNSILAKLVDDVPWLRWHTLGIYRSTKGFVIMVPGTNKLSAGEKKRVRIWLATALEANPKLAIPYLSDCRILNP